MKFPTQHKRFKTPAREEVYTAHRDGKQIWITHKPRDISIVLFSKVCNFVSEAKHWMNNPTFN
jgi:hypothetical protein